MSEHPVSKPRIHSSLSEILTYQRLMRRQAPAQDSGQSLSDRLAEVKKSIEAAREKISQNTQMINQRLKNK
ncbi:MAG TPA: hypothetical protein VHY08_01675 [Bacillota bacterium]|nr:hypothetical protein [Bacillota bacterium]